jgi:hypothetical protein
MIEGYHHYIYQTPKVDMYRILVLRGYEKEDFRSNAETRNLVQSELGTLERQT